MLKNYWKIALLALVSWTLAVSCEGEKTEPEAKDSILFAGASEIVFSPADQADKTLKFTASADWKLQDFEATWFSVTPATGAAGENTLTISLNEAETDVERTQKVVIEAGDALAAFNVKQRAVVYAESISLKGIHRIVAGYDVPLTVVASPADGRLAGDIEWVSSDEAIATVDAEGVVSALAVGQATITATAGELQAEFWVEVTEEFMTDGTGVTYTFADLAAIEFSGVTGDATEYVLGASVEIAENDVLTLGDATRVVFQNEIRLTVSGMAEFVAATLGDVEIVADVDAIPDPIYYTGDIYGGATIKNIAFHGITTRYFGAAEFTVENCTFRDIVDDESAFNLGGTGLVTISNCEFVENAGPAVSCGANTPVPLIFQDNYLYRNSGDVRNKPQINVTVPGDGLLHILRNTVIGPAEITMNGGIAVSNFVNMPGANKVEIIGNEVSDCRYGITLYGPMDAVINDNILLNNCYEENAMNGGSGVSLYDTAGGQKVYMSGNHIEGHFWGITNIGYVANGVGPTLNMGNLTEGDDYNPGGNVFVNNGNGGVLYDFYNNCPIDVMAQGNTWNVEVQDQESIESVIYHKVDFASFGEVFFMPAAGSEE